MQAIKNTDFINIDNSSGNPNYIGQAGEKSFEKSLSNLIQTKFENVTFSQKSKLFLQFKFNKSIFPDFTVFYKESKFYAEIKTSLVIDPAKKKYNQYGFKQDILKKCQSYFSDNKQVAYFLYGELFDDDFIYELNLAIRFKGWESNCVVLKANGLNLFLENWVAKVDNKCIFFA